MEEKDRPDPERKKDRIRILLEVIEASSGVLCWILVVYWGLAFALALGVIVLGFVHNRYFGQRRVVRAAMISASVFAAMMILVWIAFAIYYSTLRITLPS